MTLIAVQHHRTLATSQQDSEEGPRPLVFTEEAVHWPAMKKWSLPFLISIAGQVGVQVNVSDPRGGYPHVEEMTFADFVQRIQIGPTSEDPFIYALAGVLLEELSIDLLADIISPSGRLGIVDAIPYFWLGPAGKTVPFHIDKSDGMLVNVIGQKKIAFVAPEHSGSMRPLASNPYLSSLRNSEETTVLEMLSEQGVEVQQAVLDPGTAIWVPQGWWHQVEYLNDCVSINFWPRHYGEHEE